MCSAFLFSICISLNDENRDFFRCKRCIYLFSVLEKFGLCNHYIYRRPCILLVHVYLTQLKTLIETDEIAE